MNSKEREAIAQVLADLRKAGYCHVLYEVNQPCQKINDKIYTSLNHI